jgi:hypothetical protein
MNKQRPIAAFLLVFALQFGAFAVCAAEAEWQAFDRLGSGDRVLAEATLAPMFGDDPDLWPDWLDPRAVLIPVGRDGSLLVVRQPYRMPCGQYLFTIFASPGPDGTRERLGSGFCAGDLAVAPVRGGGLPDLLFSEGYQQDASDGIWRRVDQRVRWNGTGWDQIIKK